MSVTKADLERAKKVAPVDLSEWMEGDSQNGVGYVCAISSGRVLKLPGGDDEEATIYAWVINCFCDSDGTLLFPDNEESRSFFADRPFGMVNAICQAAMSVNGIGEEGQQATAKN
jgi:hypothetical protein